VGLFWGLRVGLLRVGELLWGLLRVLHSGLLVLLLHGMEDGPSVLLVGALDNSSRRSLISSPSAVRSLALAEFFLFLLQLLSDHRTPQHPRPPWTLKLKNLEIEVYCTQCLDYPPPQSSSSPKQSTEHVHNSCDQNKNQIQS